MIGFIDFLFEEVKLWDSGKEGEKASRSISILGINYKILGRTVHK